MNSSRNQVEENIKMSEDAEAFHHQGENSNVAIERTQKGIIQVVKKYRDMTAQDSRDRYKSEMEFLGYLRKCNIQNVPEIIENDDKARILYLEYIEGGKIRDINDEIIENITTFIKEANKPELAKEREKLGEASESINTLEELHLNLRNRLDQLVNIDNHCKIATLAKIWLKKELSNEIEKRIDKSMSRSQIREFNLTEQQKIASPSDVGIHNTIKRKDGVLYFIDFEYSGKDDLAKFACDWIIQPEKPFSESQESTMIDKLVYKMNHINKGWVNRYEIIKPLLEMKWCLIMLNKLKDGSITEAQVLKTIKYYEERTS